MNDASLAKPNSPEIQERAAILQDKLLQFRFEKYLTLLTPAITGAEKLRPRARDLLSCLAAPFAEDAETCSLLLRFFEEEAAAPDPLDPEENAVLGVLFEYAREDPDFYTGLVRVFEVTNEVNRMLEKSRDHRRPTPRKVGAILTSFGFIKRKRTYLGYMITMDQRERRWVHHLVGTHGVEGPCPLKTHPNCPLCKFYKLD